MAKETTEDPHTQKYDKAVFGRQIDISSLGFPLSFHLWTRRDVGPRICCHFASPCKCVKLDVHVPEVILFCFVLRLSPVFFSRCSAFPVGRGYLPFESWPSRGCRKPARMTTQIKKDSSWSCSSCSIRYYYCSCDSKF